MEKTSSQAEIKPVKVGEPSADNAGGNPEPSTLKEEACVESRRRVCIKCGNDIPTTKYRNAKYCSDRCRSAFIALRHAYKTGRIKKPGVGSGGAQEGEDNHMYRTGIGTYSQKGFEAHGRVCKRCGSTEQLLVHHKDHNRLNNDVSNLEVLCKRCHQTHHCVRDEQGRYTKGYSTPQ